MQAVGLPVGMHPVRLTGHNAKNAEVRASQGRNAEVDHYVLADARTSAKRAGFRKLSEFYFVIPTWLNAYAYSNAISFSRS